MKKIIVAFIILVIYNAVGIEDASAQLLRNGLPTITHNAEGDIYRARIQPFLVKADNLFKQGLHLEALNQLDLAVEAAPQNPEAYLHRAMLRFRLGMKTEAERDIELVYRMNPVATDLFGINGPKAQLDKLAFYPEDLYGKLDWSIRIANYESILNEWYEVAAYDTDVLADLENSIEHMEAALDAAIQSQWEKALEELKLLSLSNKLIHL